MNLATGAHRMKRTQCIALVLLVLIVARFSGRIPVVNGGFDDVGARNQDDIRIGVLGLFHPKQLIVRAPSGEALVLRGGDQSVVLEDSGIPSATATLGDSELVVSSGTQVMRATVVQIAGRENQPVDFVLEIPGKIIRSYHGVLEVKASADDLCAIVTLDLETAVASVLAAESAADTPLEALKAYAIAARSYFVSGRGRHKAFDFCDTTHCQFLRTPPSSSSRMAKAVADTRGQVLSYQGRSFAAMYTRSCSGRTRTPSELGLKLAAYPYYPVECEHCRVHPAYWTSRITSRDALSLQAGDESNRLAIDHRLGWSAVPSNDFSQKKEGDSVLLKGIGSGHGIGLCQAGAKAMAEKGATFLQILDHYYPNTNVVSYSGQESRR